MFVVKTGLLMQPGPICIYNNTFTKTTPTMATIILFFFILATYLLSVKNTKRKSPINGVYSAEGPFYWVKYLTFICILTLRKLSKSKGSSIGHRRYDDLNFMEQPQTLSAKAGAFDAVFFSGANAKGQTFIVAAERRKNRRINGIVYLELPELGLYRGCWLPSTNIAGDSDNEFSGSGIMIKVVEPMRQWTVAFEGKLKRVKSVNEDDENDTIDVSLKGLWSSDESIFNYDTDMDKGAAARAFAKEEWNDEYFKDLEKAHQTHYEQMGDFEAEVLVKGKQNFAQQLFMKSFRDHSFGTKRDWKLMHRYVFHHIFLVNGWKAVVGVVCQPSTCTSLECGFVSLPNGQLHPLQQCSLRLHGHGDGGNPPKEYAFTIVAGSIRYDVEVLVTSESIHFYGSERECRMVERLARYHVDGIPGSGINEWQYRNME